MTKSKSLRKPFDKSLHQRYDNKAREITKRTFSRAGFEVTDNPDIYGPDLLAKHQDDSFYLECEVKNNWSAAKFPFSTVQIPDRKTKFFDLDLYVVMLNKNCDRMLTIHATDILRAPQEEVANKYVPKGELFYQVPVEWCKFTEVK